MSKRNEDRDVFFIPPNFLTSGRLFGGSIRFRNAIEASILVLITAFPIIKLPLDLTPKIMLLCLLPLPLGIFFIGAVQCTAVGQPFEPVQNELRQRLAFNAKHTEDAQRQWQ